jgi:hypothetical protein
LLGPTLGLSLAAVVVTGRTALVLGMIAKNA